MNKIDSDIEKLEQKLRESKAKLINLTNQKKEQEKQLTLKKQLIIGEFVLKKMQDDKGYLDSLLNELDGILIKPFERELFNLPSQLENNPDKDTFKNSSKVKTGLVKY